MKTVKILVSILLVSMAVALLSSCGGGSATSSSDLVTLTIAIQGTGTVTSSNGVVNCSGTGCTISVAAGTQLQLTATPGAGQSFTGFAGACSTSSNVCTVTLHSSTNVTAVFASPTQTLTVNRSGTGAGTVTSNVGGVNCGATCSATQPSGTVVILTAAATAGSTFTGWSGACTGTGTCTVTLNAATTVTANFGLNNPAPTVTSLSVTNVLVGAGNTTITVTGTNFIPTSVGQVNGVNATTTNVTATTLDLTIPSANLAAIGNLNITVFNPAPVGGTSNAAVFTVENPVPTATTLTANNALVGAGDTLVTVTGTNFNATSVVQVNGAPAATVFQNATTLQVTILAADLGAAGVLNVSVSNPAPGGGTTGNLAFSVNNPGPTLASVTPNNTLVGSGDTLVDLTGTGFVAGSQAQVNGAPVPTTFNSSTSLQITVAAADLAATGILNLTVVNAAPGGGTSNTGFFNVNNPVPAITLLTPNAAASGSGDTVVDVTGTGFVATSQGQVNGAPATTVFVSSTALQVTVAAADLAAAGNLNLTIFNNAPGGGTSNVASFTVGNPVPVITTLTPNNTLAGSGDTLVDVAGTGFVATSQVQVNGAPAATVFNNSTSLQVTILAADLAAAGALNVTVVNPAPGGGTSNTASFSVDNPAPVITNLTPSTALVGAGDTLVDVTGTGFIAASQVQVNGVGVATTFNNNTSLQATIPAANFNAAGSLNVTVVNPGPGGGVSNISAFAVDNPVPVATTLTPNNTLAGGPDILVNIAGSGFVASSIAQVNGAPRVTVFNNANSIDVTVTAADIATGAVLTIDVVNAAPGGGTSGGLPFTVNNPAPTITTLTPNTVDVGAGNTPITVTGTGFTPASQGQVNGANATTVFNSSTSLTVTIASGDLANTGTLNVTVDNPAPGGGTSNISTFDVVNPLPTITTLNPSTALVGSGDTLVTVTGTGFVSGSVGFVNGNPRATSFTNSTSLDMVVTAADLAATGSLNISIVNPAPGGGVSAASPFDVNNPVPVVTTLTPDNLPAGSGTQVVAITGTGFVPGSVARVNGVNRNTGFVNDTLIGIEVLDSDMANGSVLNIDVVNPAPGGGASAATLPFTVNNPAPTIATLTPDNLPAGSGTQVIAIAGTGFVPGSVARVNGVNRNTGFVNGTLIGVEVLDTDMATGSVLNIDVVNAAPGGGASATLPFTVNNPAPTLNSLTPNTLLVGDPTQVVAIDGTGFVAGSQARVNGANRNTGFINSTTIGIEILDTDLLATGTLVIDVVNAGPGGGTSNTLNLDVNNPVPVALTLTPDTVNVGGATQIIAIAGSGFTNGSVARVNGVNRNTGFVNGGLIGIEVLDTDINVTGTLSIDVVNAAPGGGTSAALTLNVNNPLPAITSLSTALTQGGPDTVVGIIGTGFVPGSIARINGADRPTGFVDPTTVGILVAAADYATVRQLQVTVFNPAPGGGTSNAVLLVVNPTTGVFERTSVDVALAEIANPSTLTSKPSRSLSADGRFSVFNSGGEVWLHDSCTGADPSCVVSSQIVSVADDGSPSDGFSDNGVISATGRFVAFSTLATNLIGAGNDTNGVKDIYGRDTCIGAPVGCAPGTIRISEATDGTESDNTSVNPVISADGRYVAFSSFGTTLLGVGGDTNASSDIFVRDTCGDVGGCTPSTTLVSQSTAGTQGNNGSNEPSMSADGRFIVFRTTAFDLVPGDANLSADVLMRDTCAGAGGPCTPSTTLISIANDNATQGDNDSGQPAISPEGRYIAFTSAATTLIGAGNDTNGLLDIYMRDTCLGDGACTPSTFRVSLTSGNVETLTGNSVDPSIGLFGRYVAFASDATDLVAGDTLGQTDVFVRDTCIGAGGCTPNTIRVSVAGATEADGASATPTISWDGRFVVFHSAATNLVTDGNGQLDTFIAGVQFP